MLESKQFEEDLLFMTRKSLIYFITFLVSSSYGVYVIFLIGLLS
jgi:hypothetical protein